MEITLYVAGEYPFLGVWELVSVKVRSVPPVGLSPTCPSVEENVKVKNDIIVYG